MATNHIFEHFKKLFNDHGFRLYMIGGTSRDYLLGIKIDDYDLVTDATPSDMKSFISDGNYVFAKYGCVKVKYDGFNIDITTLREESNYVDSRHPGVIKFTNDIKIDSRRRDFTLNAIYIDENYEVHDFYDGQTDLKNRFLRMIGDPDTRIKEDPLRILRAYRFATIYKLEIDEKLKEAITKNQNLLNNINKEKIKEEINKLNKHIL